MTLNSVDYEERIVLAHPDGRVLITRIGEFIDGVIDGVNESVDNARMQHLPNDTTYVDVGAAEQWYVPNVDEDGHTSWNLIEAVTKHLPINEDGSDTLLLVRTVGGRTITATKAKSFLVRRNNKIVGIDGASLQVGDHLPATEYLPVPDFAAAPETIDTDGCTLYLQLSDYLSGIRRCSSLPMDQSALPDRFPLTAGFGFLIGAYLSSSARADVAKKQICISSSRSSNDASYRKRISDWCDEYLIDYDVAESTHCQRGTMRIHSTRLCDLLAQLCGTDSQTKTVPALIFTAPPDCLRGILDGYFSSDAKIVGGRRARVIASSGSSLLIDGICAILARFRIYARRASRLTKSKTTVLPSGRRVYSLILRRVYAIRFAEEVTLTSGAKEARLCAMAKRIGRTMHYCRDDIVPGVVSSVVSGDLHRDKIRQLLRRHPDDSALQSASQMDVVFDRIESIEEVRPTRQHVYDLTVANTRNFALFNGLHCRDTFHSAGIGEKNVTLGLPRLEELMKATKNIKTPSLTLYLTPDERRKDAMEEADRARLLANRLQYTRVRDLVQRSETVLDPLPGSTIARDRYFVEQWYETEPPPSEALGDWIVRLVLSREAMAERDFSVSQIAMILRQAFSTSDKACVYVVASDDSDVSEDDGGIIRLRVFKSAIERHIDMSMPDPEGMPDPEAIRKADPEEWRRATLELFAQNLEKHVLGMYVGGIQNIEKVHARQVKRIFYDPRTGKPKENNKEWVLETEGSSMLEVMAVAGIDGRRVMSNNPVEVAKVLGIEVARDILLEEMRAVISFYGLYVNYRHLALLCDFMTHTGTVCAISRHTLKKRNTGALMRCTFEEPVDTLHRAALESHVDTLNSVSQAVMLGKAIPHGTGMVHTMLDEVALEMHRPKRPRLTYLEDNFTSNPFEAENTATSKEKGDRSKTAAVGPGHGFINPFDCDAKHTSSSDLPLHAKDPFDIGVFVDDGTIDVDQFSTTTATGENKTDKAIEDRRPFPRIVAHNPFALEEPIPEISSGSFLSAKPFVQFGGAIVSDQVVERYVSTAEDAYVPSSPRRACAHLASGAQQPSQYDSNEQEGQECVEKEDFMRCDGDHSSYIPSSPSRFL